MKTILFFFAFGCTGFAFAQLAYVGSTSQDQLFVVDLNNETVLSSINVGGNTGAGAFKNDFSKFYVPVADNSIVLEINPITHSITDTIVVENNPTQVILNAANTLAYVCNQGSNTVSVVDLSSNTVVQTLPVGSYPTQLTLSPDEIFLCVTNYFDFEVGIYYLNPFAALSPLALPAPPVGIKPAPGFGQYVCSIQDNEYGMLALIEPLINVIDTIFHVDSHPHAVMSSGHKIYTTSLDSGTVTVIDLNNLQRTVLQVGGYPTSIEMDLTGDYYYTTNTNSGTLSRIDAATDQVVSTIPVGDRPSGIAIFPKNVGLEEIQTGELSVYPNPNNGAFTVKLPGSGDQQLILHSLDGKQIARYTTNQPVFQLDEKLASGCYILTVVNKYTTSSVKIEVR